MSEKIFPVEQSHIDSDLEDLWQRRDCCLSLIDMGEYGSAIGKFRETLTRFSSVPKNEPTHVEFLELMCKNAEEWVSQKATELVTGHTDSVKGEFEGLVSSLYSLNPKFKPHIRQKKFQAVKDEFEAPLNELLSDFAYDLRYVCKLQVAFTYLQMLVNNSLASGLIDIRYLWHIEKMFKNMEVVTLQTDGS